tara:strand:+ start:642 stop:884 length:243 start_codon:yes stop_codon:yes gene_type:complete
MDKNTRYQVGMDFKRSNGIQVERDDKKQITSIAIAHFAAGNTAEFMLGMNALGKVETTNAIIDQLDTLTNQVANLNKGDE